MTDHRLQEMLRESAATIDTSAPPIAAIARGARRRRTAAAGLVAAAVVLVGGAAVAVPHVAGTGEVSPATHAPGDGPGSTWDQGADDVPVLLPAGRPVGTFPADATLTGELRLVDRERCVVVGKDSTPVLWPGGYEGVVRADGSFDLLDESRHVVASAGEVVRLRGHWSGPASYGEECLPDTTPGKVFMVANRPTVAD